ncbi:MAG: ankyrin repeat domain-containing protein [Thaumarchaeota archaeon]|nr:ankyrin repeat domain-containing protein [Nitrososphaerota archaeon]
MVLSERDKYEWARDLHYSCRAGDLQKVKELLEQGATLDTGKYNFADTPLHDAVFSGNKELVLFLLSQGMSIDANGHNGRRPLHIAVIENNLEMVKLLLSKDALPTVRDGSGREPIDLTNNEQIRDLLQKAKDELKARFSARNREIAALNKKRGSDNGKPEQNATPTKVRGRPRIKR